MISKSIQSFDKYFPFLKEKLWPPCYQVHVPLINFATRIIGKNGTKWLEDSVHIIEGDLVKQNGVSIGCLELNIESVEGGIVARKKVQLEIGKKLALKTYVGSYVGLRTHVSNLRHLGYLLYGAK